MPSGEVITRLPVPVLADGARRARARATRPPTARRCPRPRRGRSRRSRPARSSPGCRCPLFATAQKSPELRRPGHSPASCCRRPGWRSSHAGPGDVVAQHHVERPEPVLQLLEHRPPALAVHRQGRRVGIARCRRACTSARSGRSREAPSGTGPRSPVWKLKRRVVPRGALREKPSRRSPALVKSMFSPATSSRFEGIRPRADGDVAGVLVDRERSGGTRRRRG